MIDDPTLRACLASNWALPDAEEQQVIGETLALVHQALQGATVPGARRFHDAQAS